MAEPEVFDIAFAMRAKLTDASKGFYFVEVGRLEISNCLLQIYEASEYKKQGKKKNPAFTACLSNIKKVTCQPFQSSGKTYSGGRIEITGCFDRGIQELVTLKVSADVYHLLASALSLALDG
jgi:hypothetical protein